jgi:stage II sporulation protein AA (anti-sigma F factor antagonist)
MELSFEKKDINLIVALTGEFDLHTAGYFKEKIENHLDSEVNNLILNLQTIDFIDSSGIGAILSIYKRIEKRGGKMAIINISPTLKRVFEVSGVLNVIDVYANRREAVKNIQRRNFNGQSS